MTVEVWETKRMRLFLMLSHFYKNEVPHPMDMNIAK